MARRTNVKRSAQKRGTRARSKARAKAAAPPTGPVTLDQAKALARARQPKLAAKAARAKAAPPTPEDVGKERKRLREGQRAERERRIRDYKATMDIMKHRGALPPKRRRAGKKGGGKPVAKAGEAFVPLQIFAEGDSWFDYPPFVFKGGIIPRLERRLGVPILNLAKAGDEVRYMLGVEERLELIERLTEGCPAGGPWDVLLFSGGGNDIVDNPMALWVRDFDPAVPPASLINGPRFDAALALVRAGYEDLITLRNELSPTTHLVFQGYDFAIPDGRGVCFLGPWLEPTFELRKFPMAGPRTAARAVVRAMLERFAAMLTQLATEPGVTFINGQGTLTPQTASWHNELHPSSDGFDDFAELFHDRLKALFPARVA
jgi:hypothetical protein